MDIAILVPLLAIILRVTFAVGYNKTIKQIK